MTEKGRDEDDSDIDLSNADGWGDDDFFFQEDEIEEIPERETPVVANIIQESNPNSNITQTNTEIAVEGWDDDLDGLDDDANVSSSPTTPPRHTTTTATNSHLQQEIQLYLEQLDLLKPSLNAVLQSEYSTPEKAQELIEYYSQRPALRTYTIQKELDRMEYTVVTEDGDIVTDKAEIAFLLQHDPTLVAHCANQSLLADLLQVCTGVDLLVRPQFLAAAVAQQVQFRLDLAAAVVQARATLSISLPTDHGRWNVATVQVQVVFSCHPQHAFVEYHIHSIRTTILPDSYQNFLNACARFLSSMDPHDLEVPPPSQPQQQFRTDFRDVFLQQSQAVFSNSATGLKSAWADVDSVTGLSHKLQHIPRFLPDHVLEAAASELQQQQRPVHRPTSILGGLVRTGFTKLAQSVALPEEDPSMYTDILVSDKLSPLERRAQVQSSNSPPSNPLDRLAQVQPISNQAPSSGGVNPLDRLTQVQPISNQASSTARVHPLDRLTQVQPISNQASSTARVHPLDRLTQGQHHSSQTPSRVPANPLDRLTQLRSKPSVESPLSVSSLPRSNGHSNDDDQINEDEEEVLEDGWDDVDDMDLEEEVAVVNTNQPTLSRHSPLDDSLPPDYKYNPEDDIIPTRRRWIDPRPGIRIPRPVR